MAQKPIKYCMVDAFTDKTFKGNPAAVCLLEEERGKEWMKAVAQEFNAPIVCYLTRLPEPAPTDLSVPKFRLRWFTPVAEMKLCGHGTLAATHYLLATGVLKSDKVEYLTLSGTVTAKRVPETNLSDSSNSENGSTSNGFLIELDFPVVSVVECDTNLDLSTVSKSLNDASIVEIKKTTPGDDLFVVLPSGEAVVEVVPQFAEIEKLPGRSIVITGLAPTGSGFDFFSRVFCPKLGFNEDHVTGSVHCALALYWSKELGKPIV